MRTVRSASSIAAAHKLVRQVTAQIKPAEAVAIARQLADAFRGDHQQAVLLLVQECSRRSAQTEQLMEVVKGIKSHLEQRPRLLEPCGKVNGWPKNIVNVLLDANNRSDDSPRCNANADLPLGGMGRVAALDISPHAQRYSRHVSGMFGIGFGQS